MNDFGEVLEEESEKRGLVPPALFQQGDQVGFVTGLYHGRGIPFCSDPENPRGSVGSFAQNNYYRVLVKKLKAIAGVLEARGCLTKGSSRVFCNSRFPEKEFAVSSGFGVRGKHSLVMVSGWGSFLVLGGVLFPRDSLRGRGPDFLPGSKKDGEEGSENRVGFDPTPKRGPSFPLCGTCEECVKACPTGALHIPGFVDPNRCLQAYASTLTPVPPAVKESWGPLFYGCDRCQEVCPHNRDQRVLSLPSPSEGFLGPGVPLLKVLQTPDPLLRKGLFRGTVLDRGWLPPVLLKRNALLSLASQRISGSLVPTARSLLKQYAASPEPLLADAALFALQRM